VSQLRQDPVVQNSCNPRSTVIVTTKDVYKCHNVCVSPCDCDDKICIQVSQCMCFTLWLWRQNMYTSVSM